VALKQFNTSSLTTNGNFKLKALVYSPSGFGKSLFASTAPNPAVLTCETGHGAGMLSAQKAGIDCFVPETYADMELFCSGHGLEKYDTLIVDGFSYATDTIVKTHALTIPRSHGETKKREMGILELSDYGTLAELERRLLARLLQNQKNILVTCLQDYYSPPQGGSDPRPEKIGGPDLPGMMRLGSTALFDFVFKLDMRPALKDPKDPKSRYNQRFWRTSADGKYLAKTRLRDAFPEEVPFDLETGEGTFQWFIDRAQSQKVSKS